MGLRPADNPDIRVIRVGICPLELFKTLMKTSIKILICIIALFAIARQADAITIYPAIFEFTAADKSAIGDSMQIYNESDQPVTLIAEIENFIPKGESGEQTYLSGNYGLASWIWLSERQINLAAKEKKIISFKINLPDKAAPGSYSAGILWHEAPMSDRAIGLINRVGALVLLTVSGEINLRAELAEFSVPRALFEKTPVNFTVRIANKGNVLFKPVGEISIKNIFGRTVDAIEINSFGNALLPESIRRFETRWDSAGLSFGPYAAKLQINYGGDVKLAAEVRFWVLPWKQIIIVILGIIILGLIYSKTFGKLKKKRHES